MNIFKSKTINFNVLAGAVVTILTTCGVAIPVEAVAAILTIGNFFLRFKTDSALKDK